MTSRFWRILGTFYWNISVHVTLVFGTFPVQNWNSDKDVQIIVCEYPKLQLPNSDHAVICEYIGELCSAAVQLNTGPTSNLKSINCSCWRQVFPGLYQAYSSILGKYHVFLEIISICLTLL